MAGIADTIAAAAPAVGLAFGPIGGLIGGLASALIKGFAPLAQEKLAKEVGRYTSAETAQEVSGLLTNGIVDIAQKLTGKADPVEAVVAARNDPAVMAQLEAQTMTRLDELAPMFDRIASYEQAGWKADEDSRSAAATRAISEAGSKIQWRQVTFTQIAFGAGTLAVASLLALQIVKGQPINEGLAGLFLMLLTSIANTFRTQNDYSFGSSHGSDAKSATMAEIAARRPRAQP